MGLALAGCQSPGDEDALIGPDREFGEGVEIAEDQWREVGGILRDEGRTGWAEVPASGSADYRGVITGFAGGGVPLDYVADLALEVDFRDREVSGSIRNMVTDGVAGFAHPHGEIPLDGAIGRDGSGNARIAFDGWGTLRGPGIEARYAVDAEGDFAGDRAQAMRGEQESDFYWTRGFLEGATSYSDGLFSAVEAE